MAGERATGVRDDHYDLISALYHMVEGAWKYDRYAKDADSAGDSELADLFREAQRQHTEMAERAKKLLKGRLA